MDGNNRSTAYRGPGGLYLTLDELDLITNGLGHANTEPLRSIRIRIREHLINVGYYGASIGPDSRTEG